MAKNGYRHLKPTQRTNEKKEWRDAVYQYLIDHGVWTGRLWQTTIHFENKKDFEWRIKARMYGVRRNDEVEAKKEVNDFLSKYGAYKVATAINDKFAHRINEIDKSGTFIEKIVLFAYRKCRDYLRE